MKLIGLVILCGSFLSFSSAWAQESTLTQTNQQQMDVLFPYFNMTHQAEVSDGPGRSCLNQRFHYGDDFDLNSAILRMTYFQIRWQGSAPLRLTSIRIRVSGPGLVSEATTTIQGEELASIWSGTSNIRPLLPDSGYASSDSGCEMTIGALQLKDTSHDQHGTVHVTIAGESGAKGQLVQVVGRAHFPWVFHSSHLLPQSH